MHRKKTGRYLFIQSLMTAGVLLVFTHSALADKSECSDVLRDGTKAQSLYSSNSEYRRLLETKLVNMTYQQSKTDTSLTGNIPIGDVILGVGFSEKSFNDYRSYLQQNTLLYIESSNSVDVLLSTGDQEILNAWSQCMQNRSGLSLRFTDVHAKSAVLDITWFPAAGVPKVWIAKGYRLPAGIRITSGESFLTGKTAIVAGTKNLVALEFPDAVTTLSITLSAVTGRLKTTPAGGDSSFLPTRMTLGPIESRPYAFNVSGGICSTTPTLLLDAPGKSGTMLPTVTYCSDLANGWHFSKTDFSVSGTVNPGGPKHIVHTPSTWIGDTQLNVDLGCSSSDEADIRCTATTRLMEWKRSWVPRTD